MSKTVSKGKMFAVTVEVSDERLRMMREAKGNAEDALIKGADFWHTGILPKHFEKGAGAVYNYAPRSGTYLKQSRKRGKPLLVYSGSLRQDLRSKASFQKVGTGVNLKMFARVLNFAPTMPENSADLYVKHKNGRGYPNLKREIKAVTDDDREKVAEVVAAELEHLFTPTNQTNAAIEPTP